MKVKAKHWVKYNGEWHMTGEVFDIDEADAKEMGQYAQAMEEAEPAEKTPEGRTEPVRRGRKKAAE